MKKLNILAFFITVIFINNSLAREIMGLKNHVAVRANSTNGGTKNALATCGQATANIDLDINNVRARIMNGGDMWWDRGLGVARYEVPKIDPPGSAMSVSSLFAGAVWVGGYDLSGNLRMAAQTYRQTGNDYFPGPLSLDGQASIDQVTCTNYDLFWKINYSDIQ